MKFLKRLFKKKSLFKNDGICEPIIKSACKNSDTDKETLKKLERQELKINQPEVYYSQLKTDENWRPRYNYYRRTLEIKENWVLYEAHAGAGMLCNPLALFKEFQRRDDFDKYLHFWVIADEKELKYLRKKYEDFPNVFFVRYNTVGYAYFVARCKYLINNTSFTSFFAKREDQIFLNTWHSITVKSLGFDTPGGIRIIQNMLRNMLMADYIISPNDFMTNIFNDSFKLNDVYKGKYIEEGYPRNDMVVNTKPEEILEKLEDHGTTILPDKKIILYAPTWSGNNANVPEMDMNKYIELYEYLSNNIDTDKYQLIIKPHPVVYRRLTEKEQKSGKYVSYNIDANELLSIVDIVITDYSSIYFDYLVAKKPILFYIPDFEKYSKIRGIYFTIDELPGPCAKELPELANFINNIEQVEKDYKKICDETRNWACKYDDGNVSKRILDIIFNNNFNYNINPSKKTDKKRLLIYPGSLAVNGVTSALLSLLKNIDYDKFDVSLFALITKDANLDNTLAKIPPQVRTILRISVPFLSEKEKKIYNKGLLHGYRLSEKKLAVLERIMRREFTRTLADSNFDYIIDFSGYSTYFPLFATLGCKNPEIKKIIWQHSDLSAEFSNEEKRKINKNKKSILSLLSCYDKFDKIVSASEAVYKINKESLSTELTDDKFTFATNLIDIDRFSNSQKDKSTYMQDDSLFVVNEVNSSDIKKITSIPLPKNCIKFVTMGRCMPEKNHANIITAIKRLNDEGINAMLYIIGSGPLSKQLEAQAAELELNKKIVLVGTLNNPFALLKQCDCFVFPSLYEAQGLAVLEARMVGLPIIVSNYKAVESVLIDDKQYVMNGFEAEDIYDGMMAFINGEIPTDYTFDIDEYNKKSIAEFSNLFD